jgi:hypothetical protein
LQQQSYGNETVFAARILWRAEESREGADGKTAQSGLKTLVFSDTSASRGVRSASDAVSIRTELTRECRDPGKFCSQPVDGPEGVGKMAFCTRDYLRLRRASRLFFGNLVGGKDCVALICEAGVVRVRFECGVFGRGVRADLIATTKREAIELI